MSTDIFNVNETRIDPDVECNIQMLMLPMRDGVKLQTEIVFPANMTEKAPVVLIRSPYCRRTHFELPNADALKRGCVFIMQSVRGTAFSKGEFLPADAELQRNDTEDLLNYLEKQEWFNGHCVMLGGSFSGYMQWCAAWSGKDCLKAVSPRVAPIYGCLSASRPGGGAALGFEANWTMTMYYRCKKGYVGAPDFDALDLWSKTPVIDFDKFVFGHEVPNFQKFFNSARTPGEALNAHQAWFKEFKAPAFIVGGWFDLFKQETIESYKLMRQCAKTEKAREFSRLTIGPWGHSGLLSPEVFGAENNYDLVRQNETAFLYGLLAEPERDPLPGDPKVKFFMLGENRWHSADNWPPAGGKEQEYFLHSNGSANSCRGDGRLDTIFPAVEACDIYVSDPRNPVSASGRKNSAYSFHDRKLIQQQQDVLVYSTEVLKEDLTIAGTVKLSFYAEISTPDTDFFAYLTDVTPEGKAYAFTGGMVRARFADSLEEEKLIEPGPVKRFEINLGDIAAKFKAGHRLKLDICGQNYPVFDRNANTGKPLFTDVELVPCTVKIFHDAVHPAVLTLPVNEHC